MDRSIRSGGWTEQVERTSRFSCPDPPRTRSFCFHHARFASPHQTHAPGKWSPQHGFVHFRDVKVDLTAAASIPESQATGPSWQTGGCSPLAQHDIARKVAERMGRKTRERVKWRDAGRPGGARNEARVRVLEVATFCTVLLRRITWLKMSEARRVYAREARPHSASARQSAHSRLHRSAGRHRTGRSDAASLPAVGGEACSPEGAAQLRHMETSSGVCHDLPIGGTVVVKWVKQT